MPKAEAQRIVHNAPDPIAPELAEAIVGILLPGKEKPPLMIRRSEAGKVLLEWMGQSGGFVQGEDGRFYYFFRTERRLYDLASERWACWLYGLSGVNPASPDFGYLLADCKARAMVAPKRPILRFSTWDGQVLRISRFDGTIYRLDGESVVEEANGENALFLDDSIWAPYRPERNTRENLHWLTNELPNWVEAREVAGLVLRA
jgi:hypothetical protein